MKKNLIILTIAAVLLITLASFLTYTKIQKQPKPVTIKTQSTEKIKPVVHKDTKKILDYGIHFVNEDQFPNFKKYKSSVLPFIQSQYPTNFVVDITLKSVTMDNWKMTITYDAKITESNYYSFTQKDLNYTCNVRSNVPIASTDTYQKTDSTIYGSHYNIPSGTTYLNVIVNGQGHVQFLVSGNGVCNTIPTIQKTPIMNQNISTDLYGKFSSNKTAPYIYSIIDSDGIVDGGFVNANAPTVKYTLTDTPFYTINKKISVNAGSPLYYYPSIYSQKIVETNSTLETTATKELCVGKNQYMYLVNIQGQDGWVLE